MRLALSFASIAATAPIGAMLTLTGRGRVYVGRSVGASAWMGLLGMLCVYAATTMVMSGAASLPGVGFRTAGIALGAWFMHWLTRQDPDRVRYDLGELVPWAVPVYLVLLLAVNGLLSLTWSTEGPPLGGHPLLPLYNYYIVSKAQAAKDIAGHLAMYAPVGIMIWLRSTRAGGRGRRSFSRRCCPRSSKAGDICGPGWCRISTRCRWRGSPPGAPPRSCRYCGACCHRWRSAGRP